MNRLSEEEITMKLKTKTIVSALIVAAASLVFAVDAQKPPPTNTHYWAGKGEPHTHSLKGIIYRR